MADDHPLVLISEAQPALLRRGPLRTAGAMVNFQEWHGLAIVHDVLLVTTSEEVAAVAHRVRAAHLDPCVPERREVPVGTRELAFADVHGIAPLLHHPGGRCIAACESRRQLRTLCR